MISEHDEQVGFVTWFRSRFPGVLILAIPNGEHRFPSVAKRLKDEGVVAGVPDLFVPEWQLWIEMKKARGGKISKSQMVIIDYLESIGQTVIVGRGAKDASQQVMDFRLDATK